MPKECLPEKLFPTSRPRTPTCKAKTQNFIGICQERENPGSTPGITHKIEKANRARCTACYARLKAKMGRLEAARKCRKSNYKCTVCEKAMCLGCFSVVHKVEKPI
ncbi:hypothetical protein JTB14_033826 [Gonioctena quinquepunctata]|nr:hypothetical protein JTB14_033826 [Gonioctena quinquepunctata]